jgi:hypothetical protein
VCKTASDLIRVELDAAEQTVFNPITDTTTQTVTATVWLGDHVCDASKYELVWEMQDEAGEWHTCESDAVMDYDITINGNTATINRWLMGSELHLRCRCKYDPNGNPSSVSLTRETPQAEAVICAAHTKIRVRTIRACRITSCWHTGCLPYCHSCRALRAK